MPFEVIRDRTRLLTPSDDDAVRDGETGSVVDGRDVAAVAGRLITLLRHRDLVARMGAAGRDWTEREWRWDTQARRLTEMLDGAPSAR
jgi:phosphatidylinositol alpha-1,6-mannosyltransferase